MLFKKKPVNTAGRRSASAQPSKNKAVFSYYQNRDVEHDTNKSRQKLSLASAVLNRLQHLPTLVAGLLILVSILYALSLSDQPRVSVVNDQSGQEATFLRPPEEYQAATTKLLQQSVLNSNKLTLDTNGIEQQLQEQFSELTSVAVVLPIVSRTPVVYLQVAEPVILLENGLEKFVIDEKGRALINAGQAGDLGSLNLINVNDATQLSIQPGSQVLTGHDTKFMQIIRDQLTGKGLKVARMEMPAKANEIHVFIEGKPYFVKFTTSGDPYQEVGTYLALNQQLEGKKVVPKDYVDVRVEERAYYK